MTPMTSVLIVDDEPAVRDIRARWVASLGLQPKTAATADEALATLRTRHYDMAVIDVMMPGHDGLWLASQLQRDHPHTAVVIATADTNLLDSDSQNFPVADRPIAHFLVKPVQRDRFPLALDPGRRCRKHSSPNRRRSPSASRRSCGGTSTQAPKSWPRRKHSLTPRQSCMPRTNGSAAPGTHSSSPDRPFHSPAGSSPSRTRTTR